MHLFLVLALPKLNIGTKKQYEIFHESEINGKVGNVDFTVELLAELFGSTIDGPGNVSLRWPCKFEDKNF